MAKIAVITDSTAYLPDDLAKRLDITVVPLHVVVEGESYAEGGEGAAAILSALRRGIPATTSRPTPEAFIEAYHEAAARGCEGAVSIHLSSKLSGTYESALLAAGRAGFPVRVIDSEILGMGVGYTAVAAAHAADEGRDMDEVAAVAALRAKASKAFFCVEDLEYLRRSGRIGRAQALLGSALSVKPILTLQEGTVVPLEKARTTARAHARLEALAIEAAAGQRVDLAVHHLGLSEEADALAERLRESVGVFSDVLVVEVGAVIGAHTGPGTLGVIVSPRL
jgi:DegV family protein with EDD domain